jgi:hypothetical protein
MRACAPRKQHISHAAPAKSAARFGMTRRAPVILEWRMSGSPGG